MATPASATDDLVWDDQDIDLEEEGHSRNEFQASLKKPLGFSSQKIQVEVHEVNADNRITDNDNSDLMEPQPRDMNQSVSQTLRTGGISDAAPVTFRPNELQLIEDNAIPS